jgi:phosphoadenosine phosphosulfate reductase
MPLFDEAALAAKSAELDGRPPEDILAWALAEYAPRVGISTAFGIEGCALIDMAVKLDAKVKVFTVDTDFLFPESRELVQRFVDKYGLNLTVLQGAVSKDEQERTHGVALWERDPDTCCALRKVEPTRRAVAGLDAWLAGLRRDQGPSRAGIRVLERYDHDDGSPLVKVNPLAAWTRNDTWKYVLANDVPYNPLLDQGYSSIGCWPCTRPVERGADERAGRWAGSSKKECGIHTFMIRKDGRTA